MSDNSSAFAYSYLKSKGYTDAAVSGILGNLTAESGQGLNTRAVHDNGTGLGIAGWRDPQPGKGRKTNLLNFARERRQDVYDLKTQLDFLDHELKTVESGVYSRLMKASTPEAAALAFISFERPQGWTSQNPAGGHNWSGRRANALNLYNSLSGAPPVSLDDVVSTVATDREERIRDSDISPTDVYTLSEQRTAMQRLEEEQAGFFGAAAESAWDASPIKWAYQGLSQAQEPDPNFRWRDRQDLLSEVTKDVPQEHWEAFENATSEAHARQIRSNIDKQLDLQRRISAGGWSATAGALLGETLEPVGLAASFLIPEVAGVAKLGRIGRMAAAGIGAAASNVALEMPRYLMKETASTNDLLWAAGTGLAIGGAFGALRKNPALQAEADAVERVGKSLRREVQGTTSLTPAGSTAGAMAMPGRQTIHPEMDAWFDPELHAPETGVQGIHRFDSVGQLKSSESPVARAVGGQMGLDAVGNADRSRAVEFAASEYQRRTHDGMMTQLAKEFVSARSEYLKGNDVPWIELRSAEKQMRREVSDFIRNEDPTRAGEFHPAVVRIGSKIRQLQAQYADLLHNPGKLSGRTLDPVPGFENVQARDTYLMRQVDHGKVTANTQTFGDAAIVDAFAQGMMGKNPELKPEVARKVAGGYVKRLRNLAAGVDMKGDRAASGQDLDAMRELLEEFGTLSPDEIKGVLDVFTPKKGDDAGLSSRAKHRTLFDEAFSVPLRVMDRQDPRFGETVEFRLMDLFEDDALELFENYSRQVSGLLGLHQVHVRNPRFTPDHIRPLKRAGIEVLDSQTKPVIRSEHGEVNLAVSGDRVIVENLSVKTSDPEHAREILETAADYAQTNGKRLVSGSELTDPALIKAFQDLRGDWNVHFAKTAMRTKHGKLQYARRDGKPVFEVSGEWRAPSNEPEFLVKGLAKEADWERMMQRMAQSWDELVTTGKFSHEQRKAGLELDTANMAFLRDQILGRSDKIDQSEWGKRLRRLRDYNFVRLMNNVGLAQVTEFFFATSSVGLKASLSAMPAFRHIIRNARTGELSDAVAREIEYVTSYGTDVIRGKLRSLVDDNGAALNATKDGSFGQRYDQLVGDAKRITNAISGMDAINTTLQRFAARGVYAKFAHMADGDGVNWQRLAAMGIDKEMGKRIFAQIRKHRTFIEGASRKLDLPRMNLEKWDDVEAAAHFQMGATRWAEYAVLRNDPGAMSRMVGTWFGKVIFQFRSFVIGAWARHLLHNIHMRDWQTALTFLWTGLGGALTHVAHSHLSTLGRSDREEELKRRLSAKSIILNGWARTSYASFMPQLVDTAMAFTDHDPLFTRVSGQATDAFLGNPTVGLLNDSRNAVRGLVGNSRGGNDLSQADVRNALKVFPFQNWIPLQAVLSHMVKELPENDRR